MKPASLWVSVSVCAYLGPPEGVSNPRLRRQRSGTREATFSRVAACQGHLAAWLHVRDACPCW